VSKKRLALAILDFLQTSQTDGSVAAEDAEQLEIASNCIAEAFKVDPSDQTATKDALGGQNLLAIYNVYEKLKGKSTPSTQGPSSAAEARPATPQTSAKEGDKTEAEKLKGFGNEAMKKKDYNSAIDFYTKALDIIPLNPIYLSNRAAAYSGQGKHQDAKNDAEMAVAADPKYSKAWSRLGLANYVLGDAKGAMEAYKSGMDAEEGGGSEVMRKGYETAKKKFEEEGGDVGTTDRGAPGGGAGGMPDLGSLASMLGGGGGGGAGGMPDFAAMMNNPMMRQMAQNVMQNPEMLSGLMNNPRIAEMAQQFGGGGGAGGGTGGGRGGGGPDLSSLMNDPSIREM
jgi:small glutamine-rich tetratricopeptide repeat-containing protein alpha